MITIDQHIANVRDRLNAILADNGPLFLASQSALVEFSERVFSDGKDINGGKFIYDYKKPLYINPDKSPVGFETKGKPKGSGVVFKSGKRKGQEKTYRPTKKAVYRFAARIRYDVDLKTRWFPSYQDYRKEIKYRSNFVNWTLSGDLKSEIENKTSPATPKQISEGYEISVASEENTGKLLGLKTKYPNVFVLNQKERKIFFTTFDKELKRKLREGFGNG